jgi:hypothetical protein
VKAVFVTVTTSTCAIALTVGSARSYCALRCTETPCEKPLATQVHALKPLKRLLELDGFLCNSNENLGQAIPLLVQRGQIRVAIGIKSGLLDDTWNAHSLNRRADGPSRAQLLNDYILRRNLPDEHQLIRGLFEALV